MKKNKLKIYRLENFYKAGVTFRKPCHSTEGRTTGPGKNSWTGRLEPLDPLDPLDPLFLADPLDAVEPSSGLSDLDWTPLNYNIM